MEVALGVAPAAPVPVFPAAALPPSFGTKLFMLAQASISVPSTEKCSLESSLRTCGRFSTLVNELGRDIAVEQPIPVLAEHGRIPHRIVRRQPDEPAEQQIVVELLHQLPFRAHRVERLQQQRAQQPLRRDRRPSVARIQACSNARDSSPSAASTSSRIARKG